jgi:diacylglycerol kinase (ATP)
VDAVRFRVLNAPRRIAAGAVENLRAVGRDVSLHFTAGPGHAAELARTLVEQGCQRLIVCGGDGTVNAVLPALAHREVTLGLIPAGTGNDFARALSIPRSWRAAVRLQICGQPRRFDLGRCGERYFCTIAAFGFDALVSQSVHDRRRRNGMLRPPNGSLVYLLATIQQLAGYQPREVRVEGEFGVREGRFLLIATANTSSYGGGMRIAPQADPQDGQFDICIVKAVSAAAVIALLPRMFTGRHVRHPAVSVLRSAWLRLEPVEADILHLDGELAGNAPANLQVVPGALSVVVPVGNCPS